MSAPTTATATTDAVDVVPVQLAGQRLLVRLADLPDTDDVEVLERATRGAVAAFLASLPTHRLMVFRDPVTQHEVWEPAGQEFGPGEVAQIVGASPVDFLAWHEQSASPALPDKPDKPGVPVAVVYLDAEWEPTARASAATRVALAVQKL